MNIITCNIGKVYRKEKGKKEDKLIIVKVAQEPLGVGYAIPLQLVLSICHGEWSKHERGRDPSEPVACPHPLAGKKPC